MEYAYGIKNDDDNRLLGLTERSTRMKKIVALCCIIGILLLAGCQSRQVPVTWQQKIAYAVEQHSPQAEKRLKPYFSRANVHYPPQQIALLVFKQEKRLELWARQGEAWRYIKTYPILAASGQLGPKLRSGDRQVPEGSYQIVEFNPESKFHLSMELNYPNAFDKTQASRDGRNNLGNEIYIHGKNVSRGCIAVGDQAVEELFILVYRAGIKNTRVIIAPHDLRFSAPVEKKAAHVPWLSILYENLQQELAEFV